MNYIFIALYYYIHYVLPIGAFVVICNYIRIAWIEFVIYNEAVEALVVMHNITVDEAKKLITYKPLR